MRGWALGPASRRTFLLLAIAIAATAASLASPGTAATSTKYYTLGVAPASVGAGTTTTVTVTLGNSGSSTQTLGSANVNVPSAFTVGAIAGNLTGSGGQHWTACLGDGTTCGASPGNVLMLRANSSSDALAPGDTVGSTLTATTTCTTGTYVWTSAAKQSNSFNGPPGNNFTLSGGSPSVTVVAGGGAPTYFTVTAPGSVTAGTSFDATVTAYDACHNQTGYFGLGTVSGNLGAAPDGTSPVYGLVSFDGTSSATATVTAYRAETLRTLTVSMGIPYADATSNTFSVVPAAPAAARFTTQPNVGGSSDWQRATGSSLTQFSTAVSLYDAYGNLATNAGGAVALSLVEPPAGYGSGGSLGGTTSVTPGSGVATFTDLTVDTSGVGYTLDATYPGAAGTTSSAFNVYDNYTLCSSGATDCTSGTVTNGSGLSQSQGQAIGSGGFFSLGLGSGAPGYVPAGCQTFSPLDPSDVPLVVIDERTSVGGTLTVVYGANIKALKKKYSQNSGQQFIPICVGAMRIALGGDGKTHGVPCNQPYNGISQAGTGWWGKTLDANGKFASGLSRAVCDPTTGYFFGIVGSFQDYTGPDPTQIIDPGNSPTVTAWGTDPSGNYRNFTIVYPASSDTDGSGAFAGVPWDGWNFG